MRFSRQFGFGALMLLVSSGACSAASTAAISGVVRDAQGVAQMGVMVQVLAAGSINIASAFTDMHGRYKIAALVPGSYQVRATSALFIAATRRNLRLSTGMLATVNLTVSLLSDPVAWLPAERRKADEPGDDWTWTLRSAANRPILRMLGDGEVVPVSSDEARPPALHARFSARDGGSAFATGGFHTSAALDHAAANGSVQILRTDIGDAASSAGGPTAYIAAGYERTSDFTGSTRTVISYTSNPGIVTGHSTRGVQGMRFASAKKMQLGDAVDVEAGGTVYAIHTSGTAFTSQPFVRVTVHPGEVWAVRYSLATSPEMQGFDGVNSIQQNLPIAGMTQGRLCTESGRHQEFSISRKIGSGSLQAAVFRDAVNRPAISGVNAATLADVASASTAVLVDTQTGSFRFLGAGFSTTGASIALSEPITPSVWATLEYERGAALASRGTESDDMSQVASGLHAETADSFTASVKGNVLRTGTRIRAAYRWQPQHLVTAVDAYDSPNQHGYLGFYIRQSVSWTNHLPPGLEATVDVTNLLAEGYRPFLSADGHTLFLAESPRTIQAGLSFTF
jgi:hypothetical protein